MKIQKPTVGPIVGYTQETETRIWLRGDFQSDDNGGYRRCFGVIQFWKKGSNKISDPVFVKLPPHFDMTGVCVATGLIADTEYEYQAGWFFAETSLENLNETQILDWTNAGSGSFRTSTFKDDASRSYVVGSCRYLLKLFGGTIFDERGDKTFYSISEQIKNGRRVDALVMVGDQIYADDLNALSPDQTVDQFLERYRCVFGQKYLQQLMSNVPTYMVLDDHEIEDNWPIKASDKDWHMLYPSAIHAYQIYQCSHSPLFETDNDDRITGTLSRFWYTFQDGCVDWFVMDSRTERIWDIDPVRRSMVKDSQMKAIKKWLSDGSGRAKFIVTSVPFFPDLKSESEDKWGGYLQQRTELFTYILEQRIPKVVFLSGDVHCSFSAELTSPSDPDFKITSIVSSSFFWPYPHMDDSDFVLKGTLTTQSGCLHTFNISKPSKVFSTDNFARIEVDSAGLDISFFERKGDSLGKSIRRDF